MRSNVVLFLAIVWQFGMSSALRGDPVPAGGPEVKPPVHQGLAGLRLSLG
jgi:hypothetical protein